MAQLLPAKLNANSFVRWIDRDHKTLFVEPPRIDKRIFLSFRVKRLKFTLTAKRRIIPNAPASRLKRCTGRWGR